MGAHDAVARGQAVLDALTAARSPSALNGAEMPDDLPPLPPIEAYGEEEVAARGRTRREILPPASVWSEKATPAAFSSEQLLALIEPERYLVPGIVPIEAYTILAGALSAAKTTLLHTLLLWRATGFDLLDLSEHSIDIGPCVLVSYEDSDRRILRRFQILVQYYHRQIGQTFGTKAAAEFITRIEQNLRRITLTGEADAGIVMRLDGAIVPNHGFLDHMLGEIGKFARSDVLVGLDPLPDRVIRLTVHRSTASYCDSSCTRSAQRTAHGPWP